MFCPPTGAKYPFLGSSSWNDKSKGYARNWVEQGFRNLKANKNYSTEVVDIKIKKT